jgi:hypothetical protein
VDYTGRSQWPCSLRRGSGRSSLAGIAGSNLAGVHGYLSVVSVVCCQVEVSVSDHSTRGVLPSVTCLSVIVKSRKGEGPRLLRAVRSRKEGRIIRIIC